MRNQNSKTAFFLIVFLIVISIMQYSSVKRSVRLNDSFDRIIENLINIQPTQKPETPHKDSGFYPGDEGDWRIWAFNTEPRTLNSLSVERDIYSIWITQRMVFEPLLQYDFNTIQMVPCLAEKYEISEDGLEITFTLRDDIHFSDGVKVTTDDVMFTYQTITDPRIDIADLANQFNDVKEVIKIDDRVIKFVMNQVYFKSLETVSFWDVGVYPKHIYHYDDPAEFNSRVSDPVGSGPYVFEKWDIGDSITLKRNENYWGPIPKLRKIVYKFIGNDVARAQALRSGQVDMIITGPEQYADLIAEPGFTEKYNCLSYWTPATPFYYLGWNQNVPFFKDRLVRLAMTHIVDRESIVSSLLKGNATVVTGPFYHQSDAYDNTIEPWPYDIEKAKKILDQAGWIDSDGDGIRDKDGVKFSFKLSFGSGNTFYARMAKMIKDSAEKVGVEVNIDPVEWSIMMIKLNDRDFEAVSLGWGGEVLEDPYTLWHSSQIENRGSNYCGFKNQELDRLIELGRRTLDDDKRNEIYRRIHRILHQEQPYTFVYSRPTMRIVDKRYKNVNIYPLGLNYLEWYVPIKDQKYR